MDLTTYEIEALKQLMKEEKNAYQVHKGIKEENKEETYYATILRALERLEDKKLIKKVGTGARDAKIYQITVEGLANLYLSERKGRDDLSFHHSIEAKQIIERIVEELSRKMNFRDKEKEKFSEVACVSPSLIKYFANWKEKEVRVFPLRGTDFFEKLPFGSNDSQSPLYKLLCIDKIEEDCFFLWRFYTEILPLTVLANDFLKYRDKEIGFLLFKILYKENERKGKALSKWEEFTFRNILLAVKKGLIDPNQPADEQYGKYLKSIGGEEKTNCSEHWKLYIPPTGRPVLACEGCSEKQIHPSINPIHRNNEDAEKREI